MAMHFLAQVQLTHSCFPAGERLCDTRGLVTQQDDSGRNDLHPQTHDNHHQHRLPGKSAATAPLCGHYFAYNIPRGFLCVVIIIRMTAIF